MNENILHIAIALISALGSVGAWRFYELKLKYKKDQELSPQKANELFIKDLQSRVTKLESLLIESSKEKDKLREDVIELTAEVAALKEKSKHLDKENIYLKGKTRGRKPRK